MESISLFLGWPASLTDVGFESLSPHVRFPLFGITLGGEAMESLLYGHANPTF
jgi:hypothetical protein